MQNINTFSNEEIERYSRQIILQQIGGAGQQKLKASKILTIGAGGLGAPVLQYLSAAGVGELGIIDDDFVELSNLQRQVIHGTDRIGQAKTQSAYKTIKSLNPNIKVNTHDYRLEATNAQEIFAAYDIIIDCCDNFSTRYLIADTAQIMHKPCISGAINQFNGMITVLMPYKDQNPSYRDIFPRIPQTGMLPNCTTHGVIGAIAGIIGSMQALEGIKLAAGIKSNLVGKLLIYHGLQARFQTINYKQNY